MRYIIEDKKYRFKSAFDTVTGAYVRTGVLDEEGRETGIDPFMASYPHLIDVGIMGHCIHGKTGLCAKAGIGCYQSGLLVEKAKKGISANGMPFLLPKNEWLCINKCGATLFADDGKILLGSIVSQPDSGWGTRRFKKEYLINQ